ncbi:MAG TPA: ribose-phosphate pyrophosphokinase-like domain-containing protein, partial [Firmicutes bacterium]|nr:ribose-phosphate pyrophosphokinase-like domain-containing protein [Bacillota bacterium]
MAPDQRRLKVFSGNAHPDLAREIAAYIGVPLGAAKVSRFSNGEIQVVIDESVRGADIFVVQSIADPVNESIMELLILMDAFRRASARRITAVIPHYGYARQDRKARGREPISAKLRANLLVTTG